MREMVAKCNDPYMNNTPWEIFRNEKGHVIGEYFRHVEPAHDMEQRKIGGKRKNEISRNRSSNSNGLRRT